MSLRRFPALLLLASAGAAAPTPAGAQSQAQRTLIEAFRDSLDRVADTTGLGALEADLVRGVRREPGNPTSHLRLGFLTLRLGDLGRGRGYEDAAAEFQAVTRMAPGWPYGWYGLGLAEYALANTFVQRGPEGGNPARGYNRAVAALARSARADTGFAETLVEQAVNGRLRRQPSRSTVALEALRVAAASFRSASLLHGLGKAEREFGDPEAALQAFDALLSLAGRHHRGVPLLEVARTRFLLGRADGAAAYYEGAVYDDSLTVNGYRIDIEAIASPRELAEFDASRGAGRAGFLRRFWGSRDAAEFRPTGERIQEHYRRLYYARRHYPAFVPTRWRDLSRRIALADVLDDRGLVYLRHGEPDDRVSMATLGFEPNESWRYAGEDGDMVVHFVARHAPDDFHLVESLFDVVDSRADPAGGDDPVISFGDEQLLRSREPLSPFYRASREEPDRERAFRVAERAMSHASAVLAMSSDSYRRRYARSLGASADVVVLEESPGNRTARIALAVPFAETGTEWLGEGLTFPLRVRVVGLDPAGSVRVAVDSTVRPRAVIYRGQRWLAGGVAIPVPAGPLRLRLAVEDEQQEGSVLPMRAVEGAGSRDSLLIGALAVGSLDSPWRVETGAGPVVLNPLDVLGRERAAEVSFEVHGRPGTILSCQITVIRIDSEPAVAFNASWREAMSSATRLIRRRLEAERLKPGTYRVEITVSDGQSGLARRWQELRIGS